MDDESRLYVINSRRADQLREAACERLARPASGRQQGSQNRSTSLVPPTNPELRRSSAPVASRTVGA
jgi:hypothetical protein